jgi:hypothetical protein
MKTGQKATGQEPYGKLCVIRHGRGSRRGANAAEKAIETRVRQAGKKAVKVAQLDL